MARRLLWLTLALSLLLPPAAGASVLYVGDSLGVGTVPYLRGQLGGVAITDDSEIGRPSGVGVDVLGSLISPQADVVVFDLGTNDDPASPATLATDLASARQIAGDRCMVVATLNRPPLNGVPVTGLNRAVTAFASSDPNVELVDWHAAAVADPGMLIDGIHTDATGYSLRAHLFAEAIASCLRFASSPATAPPAQPSGGSGGGGSGRDRPERDADRTPAVKPERKPSAVRELAGAVAKSVAVGADFG
jgi:lysophospholipase L1-like esterase